MKSGSSCAKEQIWVNQRGGGKCACVNCFLNQFWAKCNWLKNLFLLCFGLAVCNSVDLNLCNESYGQFLNLFSPRNSIWNVLSISPEQLCNIVLMKNRDSFVCYGPGVNYQFIIVSCRFKIKYSVKCNHCTKLTLSRYCKYGLNKKNTKTAG